VIPPEEWRLVEEFVGKDAVGKGVVVPCDKQRRAPLGVSD
jgi:hypothetical protein